MIRLTFLLRRKAGIEGDDFRRYWRDEHGPLVASHQHRLGFVRYVQVHRDGPDDAANGGPRGPMEPVHDGAAEVWWPSEDALVEAMRTEPGRRAAAELVTDEERFVDLAASPLWLAHEYPQVNPSPENVRATETNTIMKLYFPLRHRPELGFEDAQRYWRVQHGPLIRRMAPAMGMLRYQQVHRYESPIEASMRHAPGTKVESYAGHAEAWFDRAARRKAPEISAAARAAADDEAQFIDFTRSTIWYGKEHVLVDRW